MIVSENYSFLKYDERKSTNQKFLNALYCHLKKLSTFENIVEAFTKLPKLLVKFWCENVSCLIFLTFTFTHTQYKH